jgi:hypothetical protein
MRMDVDGFAAGLRQLHRAAGKPTYQQLQRQTGYGRTVLSAALNGTRLPTWPVTEALVQALGGDPAEWRARWASASTTEPETADEPAPQRRRRWPWAVATAAVILVAATVFVALREHSSSVTARPGDATAPAAGLEGTCMTVTAHDVRVFASSNGDEPWTTWKHGTRFWVDRAASSPHRYRTVLRDGRHGWVTNDKHYVQPASGCP